MWCCRIAQPSFVLVTRAKKAPCGRSCTTNRKFAFEKGPRPIQKQFLAPSTWWFSGWLNGCHLYIARRVIYQIDTSIRCVQICVNKSFRKPFHSPKHHWRPKKKKEKRKEKRFFLFYIKPKVIVARNYTLCLTFSLKFPNTRTIYCTLIEEDFVCGEWRQSQQTFLHYRTNSNRLACINLCWIFIRTQRQDYK
jgi:hypothetical protein